MSTKNPLSTLLLNVTTPGRMPLLHPKTAEPLLDTDGNPGYIDVWSADAEAVEKYWRSIRAKGEALNDDEREKRSIGSLVAATAGWYLVGVDRKPIDYPFSPENALAFYSDRGAVDIIKQVGQFSRDHANFAPASSNN